MIFWINDKWDAQELETTLFISSENQDFCTNITNVRDINYIELQEFCETLNQTEDFKLEINKQIFEFKACYPTCHCGCEIEWIQKKGASGWDQERFGELECWSCYQFERK